MRILGEAGNRIEVAENLKYVYRLLACQIYITGIKGIVDEEDPEVRSIGESMEAARLYFEENCQEGRNQNFPNESIWKKYHAVFHLSDKWFEAISANFQSILTSLGEKVAGDEKLFHFTGDTPYLRLVPTKPDRIGLWMYELCVNLPNKKPYLVHCSMEKGSAKLGISSTVLDIITKWVNVIEKFEDNAVILFIDSYYHSQAVHNKLVEGNIKYAAASTANSFGNLCKVLESKVRAQGKYAIAWKENTTELFAHYFSPDNRLGRKFVLTTAYEIEEGRLPNTKRKHIPGIDLYSKGFNICDNFNHNLANTSYPHKTGGNTRYGVEGQTHKYMLAVLLQNIFAMFDAQHPNAVLPHSNKSRCSLLAKELYAYSFSV